MIKFLIPLLLLALLVVLARRYITAVNHPGEKRYRQINVALWTFAAVMLLLTLLHRMHWLGALVAIVLPLLRTLLHRIRRPPQDGDDDKKGQGS